jgi:hypothetical protein
MSVIAGSAGIQIYVAREREKGRKQAEVLERRLAAAKKALARERALVVDLRTRIEAVQVWMTLARNEARSAKSQIEYGDNLRQGDSAHYQVSEAIDSIVMGLRLSRTRSKA